jgi:hypothetical protein
MAASKIVGGRSSKGVELPELKQPTHAKHMSLILQSSTGQSQTPLISKINKVLNEKSATINRKGDQSLEKDSTTSLKKVSNIFQSSIKVSSLENILSFSTMSSVAKASKKALDSSSTKKEQPSTISERPDKPRHEKSLSLRTLHHTKTASSLIAPAGPELFTDLSLNNFNLHVVIGRGGFGKVSCYIPQLLTTSNRCGRWN